MKHIEFKATEKELKSKLRAMGELCLSDGKAAIRAMLGCILIWSDGDGIVNATYANTSVAATVRLMVEEGGEEPLPKFRINALWQDLRRKLAYLSPYGVVASSRLLTVSMDEGADFLTIQNADGDSARIRVARGEHPFMPKFIEDKREQAMLENGSGWPSMTLTVRQLKSIVDAALKMGSSRLGDLDKVIIRVPPKKQTVGCVDVEIYGGGKFTAVAAKTMDRSQWDGAKWNEDPR